MNPEERETEMWVECDECGRTFGGPGLGKVVVPVVADSERLNLCTECVERLKLPLAPAENQGNPC